MSFSIPHSSSYSSFASSFSSNSKQDKNYDSCVITNGILSLLDKISVPNAVFCKGPSSMTLAHFGQKDNWSCGYRNLQMLLSSIMPNVYPNHPLFAEGRNRVPSINELQTLFEMSWEEGFDRDGADFYNHRLCGTNSVIGAVEVASLLSYLAIDSVVVQFEKSELLCWDQMEKFILHYFSKPCNCELNLGFDAYDVSYPDSASDIVREVLDSVQEFGHDCPVDKSLSCSEHSDTESWSSLGSRCECFNSPLYLQWEGHSVTVVGIEKTIMKRKNKMKHVSHLPSEYRSHVYHDIKYNLLVFDPLKEASSINAALKIAIKFGRFNSNIIDPLRVPLSKIPGKKCQIIVCTTRPLPFKERKNARYAINALTVKS